MQSHFLLPGILALQDAQMDASTMRRMSSPDSKVSVSIPSRAKKHSGCAISWSQGLVIDDHPYER